jgi:hypothetical protein
MYRRPLPATHLRFLSSVMFDGRESSPLTHRPCAPAPRIRRKFKT